MQQPPRQPDADAVDQPDGLARPGRLMFRRRQRLSGRRAFAAVFDHRLRHHGGPLTFFARANGLSHSRLGLSVGRRVGSAVVRNRIKRRLREAFRLGQAQLPTGYDWVVAVRPHDPLRLEEYQQLMRDATEALERKSRQRDRRNQQRAQSP